MKLPLIKRIKNEFCLIQKNYININRNQSIIKLQYNEPSSLKFNVNLDNNKIKNDNNKYNEINNKTRNNNKITKSLIFNKDNRKYVPNIINNIYSNFSHYKNKNKYNTIFSKKIHTSDNSLLHSSYINDYSLEKKKLNSNRSNPNLIIQNEKEINKIDKILTKFKLSKIIADNSQKSCYIQERNNSLFLERHKNNLLNDRFISSEINKHRNFIFDKNENQTKRLNNFLISIENSNSKRENVSSDTIMKSLTSKDIKLIKSDISYFKDINENIIKDLIKLKSNTFNLLDILNQEEEEKKQKYKLNKKIKNEINRNEKNILYNYSKYINKLINDDLSQRLRKIKLNHKDKNIDKVLNEFPLKINRNIGRIRTNRSKILEDMCFKAFLTRLKYSMKKNYSLERNKKRLINEKSFQYKKELKIRNDDNEKYIIKKCLEKFKKV